MKMNNCKDIETTTNDLYELLKDKYEGDIKNINTNLYGFDNEEYSDIVIEADNYIIYISISINYETDKIEYDLCTKNLNRKEYDIYEEEYKNKATRKNTKGIITYINKFI